MTTTHIPTDTIEHDELRRLLASQEGDYVAAYDAVVEEAERRDLAAQARHNTRSYRVERWKAELAKNAKKKGLLTKVGASIRSLVPLAKANAEITASDEPAPLTPAQAKAIAEEMQAVQATEEFTKARREAIKARVFAALDEGFAAQGEEHPDHVNGSIEVPELGVRLSREGAESRDKPELNEEALAAFVGEELWNQITIETVIPAQVVRKVNLEALMAAARKDPEVLVFLQKSLTPGKWKSPRFVLRDM